MSQAPGGAGSQDGLPNTQDITDITDSQSQELPAGEEQGQKWGRLFPVGIHAKFDGLGESIEKQRQKVANIPTLSHKFLSLYFYLVRAV